MWQAMAFGRDWKRFQFATFFLKRCRSYSEPDFSKAIEDLKSRADASKEGSKIQKDGYYHLPGREAVAFAVQEQLLPCCLMAGVGESVGNSDTFCWVEYTLCFASVCANCD